MKALKIVVVSFISTVGFLISGGIAGVEAQGEYLGEFCWEFGTPPAVAVLAITHMGDGHFLVNGRVIPDVGQIFPVHGSAEIVGNQVHMTTNYFGEDPFEIWAGTTRGMLNLATLNGTVDRLETFHNKSDPDPENAHVTYFVPETATSVPCP